jgi:hypothetical protein
MKSIGTAALRITVVGAALLAGGCAGEMSWQRADGRPLDRSFGWAASECRSRARDHWRDRHEAMQRCMRRHGYVWTAVAYGGRDYGEYDD